MDEEEILRSSLEQSNKIDIDSFFGSPIGGLANRAIMQSNNSLRSSITNRGLIASLQASIELLKSQVRQITNYVLIDRQERNKLIRQRETEIFEREDDIQKGIVSPESAQPRGLEDSLPFFPEARFSEGLTAGMSSIGERQGVAQFQERFVEGSRPFFFGGLVPGSGDADTVNAKLTPGEFVVPKEKVEEVGSNSLMNFVRGIGNSIRNFDGRPGSKDFDIENLRYEKIIIMTDADVDGSHIRTLLLTFFNNKPFNELIEKGHLYLAQPPLFKVTRGTKSTYIKNEKDLEKYILKSSENGAKKLKKSDLEKFLNDEKQKLNIQRFKGLGEMNPEELWQTTLNPENRTLLKIEYSKGSKEKSKEDQNIIKILMGDEVAPRKDFITEKALEVENLDI